MYTPCKVHQRTARPGLQGPSPSPTPPMQPEFSPKSRQRRKVAAVPLVTAFFGQVVHAACVDCPTSGLKVDLPQLISEPPTQ